MHSCYNVYIQNIITIPCYIPLTDRGQLKFEDYVHYFRMVAKAIMNGNSMAITGMFVLVFYQMPIVCDMFSLIEYVEIICDIQKYTYSSDNFL